jgi:hypothetical protein
VQALAKKKNITLSDTLKNPEMQKHMQLTKDREHIESLARPRVKPTRP